MSTILLAEGQLMPSCSKSHITYMFNIKNKINRLNIDFSYEPKILEDKEKSRELILEGVQSFVDSDREKFMEQWERFLPLNNLLSVSVDDINGFRGCVHRHTPKQNLFITKDEASPGLIPGVLNPGMWKVTISVHAVLTDVCRYKLHIWEGEMQK